MHTNVENVLERDRKLGDLEERADALQDGCAQFEKQVRVLLIIINYKTNIEVKSAKLSREKKFPNNNFCIIIFKKSI